jgi:hypothetical protein
LLAANPALEARYQILGRSLEAVEDELGTLERIKELAEEREKQLDSQASKYKDLQKIAQNLADDRTRSLQAEILATKAQEKANKAASMAMVSGLKQVLALFFQIDEAVSDFNRKFRFGPQYEEDMRKLAGSMYDYGRSAQEVLRVQGELITGFTDFTKLSDEQQKSISEAVNIFDSLGVSSADAIKTLQMGTKAFGLGVDELVPKLSELSANASALQMSQTEYFATLARSGPLLAKFGNDFDITFKRLQHTFKVTGLEMEKVLGITNKFDTFEGAAKQAGKLNAALGGNFVNAMDLMMATDPVERFEMIRDSILDAGLSFENMSYYQRLFYTESLGLNDTNELAMLLSGNMNDFSNAINANAKSMEEQKEAAKAVMSVQQQLLAFIRDNQSAFTGLGKILVFVGDLIMKFDGVLGALVKGFVIFKGVFLALGPVLAKIVAIVETGAIAFGVTSSTLSSLIVTLGNFATSLTPVTLAIKLAIGAIISLTTYFIAFKEDGLVSKSPSELVLRVNELVCFFCCWFGFLDVVDSCYYWHWCSIKNSSD